MRCKQKWEWTAETTGKGSWTVVGFLARLSTATPSSEPCKRVENSAHGRASVPTAVLKADSHQDSPLDGGSHGLGTGE